MGSGSSGYGPWNGSAKQRATEHETTMTTCICEVAASPTTDRGTLHLPRFVSCMCTLIPCPDRDINSMLGAASWIEGASLQPQETKYERKISPLAPKIKNIDQGIKGRGEGTERLFCSMDLLLSLGRVTSVNCNFDQLILSLTCLSRLQGS